ncbi:MULTISPECIES: aspartate-alanine antiporter [unclassified Pseudodesulfovibrio]|uniref:aspartate-alanine antiporter n=1 Tax=unclassified Pseudodesulfovibrio TaxID=2661612 RepID=UPI0019D43A9A|nr:MULTISPECIES: aspartate-alanine antiporter [unclassified Pseudodesulfovibrio]MCJ2164723.1 aspartate-alanine antiporter [Pseudodesulfovibrio sp. S3-i]
MEVLRANPFMALFLALAFGYFIGKFKVGKFQLGGIAGTLIAAVIIGQIGIQVDDSVKSIFFALFIYAVGYSGGPEFFSSINRSTLAQVVAAIVMTVTGLITVLFFAKLCNLGVGLAAGLAAGGLTQSAIIGTAGSAIDLLGQAKATTDSLKVDIAVGYSVTYIIGSLGPILMITVVFPMLYKWDLRQEAVKLAQKLGGGGRELGEGEYTPLARVGSRVYRVSAAAAIVGHGRNFLEDLYAGSLRVEAVLRQQEDVPVDDALGFQPDDLVMVTGLSSTLEKCAESIGEEHEDEDELFNIVEESRKIVVTNKKLHGRTLDEVHHAGEGKRYGVFFTALARMGHSMPLLPKTEIHTGDELTLTGSKRDLDRIEKLVGYKSPSLHATEFMTFGLGMVVGYLLGLYSFHVGSAQVSLGSGLGCLVSGLLFGYMRTRHPRFGGVDTGAISFLQTFGLAVFVGVVGLNAGEAALTTIKEHGVTLIYLGAGVAIIPQVLGFAFNYYVLKIKNPVVAMGVVAGSRSANPAFSALLDKTGNATPVSAFTVTYALANILLTLWGPVIVAVLS